MITEGLFAAYLPKADWAPLVSNFGYCVGFVNDQLRESHGGRTHAE